MAKNKRSREEAETYDSDGGFVSNDDGNAPKSKKSKKASASKGGSGDGERFWAVSKSLCRFLILIADLFTSFRLAELLDASMSPNSRITR
jgi:hypothetical protein